MELRAATDDTIRRLLSDPDVVSVPSNRSRSSSTSESSMGDVEVQGMLAVVWRQLFSIACSDLPGCVITIPSIIIVHTVCGSTFCVAPMG